MNDIKQQLRSLIIELNLPLTGDEIDSKLSDLTEDGAKRLVELYAQARDEDKKLEEAAKKVNPEAYEKINEEYEKQLNQDEEEYDKAMEEENNNFTEKIRAINEETENKYNLALKKLELKQSDRNDQDKKPVEIVS